MATIVISGTISDADGFLITVANDYFFTATSLIQATGTNEEAITVNNGETVTSVVTVAGNAIGNRVGMELDGSDTLLISNGAVVRDERTFGSRTLGADNQVIIAGTVGGNDSGVELDGDRDRLTIAATCSKSGALDAGVAFRPAGVNLRGKNNVLENAGTIFAGRYGRRHDVRRRGQRHAYRRRQRRSPDRRRGRRLPLRQ